MRALDNALSTLFLLRLLPEFGLLRVLTREQIIVGSSAQKTPRASIVRTLMCRKDNENTSSVGAPVTQRAAPTEISLASQTFAQ